ncbi:hypothetical protein C8J31_11419 [Rhizobium sp. PP-CC-2G-626]|nr:hypothetical protein C8J31_11419 [Rhizobium sp. PP-CC-2G-626]
MTAIMKAAIHEFRLDFVDPIDRARYAQIMVLICGLIAGASYILFETAAASGYGRETEIGLAISCLVSIAVMLHVLGHIGTSRDGIASTVALGGSAALAGALGAYLVSMLTNNPFPFVVVGVIAVGFSAAAGRASWIRENSSKARTLIVTSGAVLANAVFALAFLLS